MFLGPCQKAHASVQNDSIKQESTKRTPNVIHDLHANQQREKTTGKGSKKER